MNHNLFSKFIPVILHLQLIIAADWKRVLLKAPWSGRSDPQLVNLNGNLLLLGGHANDTYYNDVWRSSDAGKTWERLPDAPWAPRSYHNAKVLDDNIYLLGGYDSQKWYNDIWKSSDGKAWKLINPGAKWEARAAAAFQIRRKKMYVMGGSNGLLPPIGNGTLFNDVWVSENYGVDWTQLETSAPWPAREGLQKLTALYGDDDMIILTSGEAGYFGPYFHDV